MKIKRNFFFQKPERESELVNTLHLHEIKEILSVGQKKKEILSLFVFFIKRVNKNNYLVI